MAKSVFTSHWLLAVCGLVFYFIYFLHLLWGNKISSVAVSSISAAFACLLVQSRALTEHHQVLGVAPLFLGVVGAVLQFDSRDTSCNSSFPALLHQGDFEIHILIEFVGAVIAGVFMVRGLSHTHLVSVYLWLSTVILKSMGL